MKTLNTLVASIALALCAAAPSAYADPLSSADNAQLQTWLGQGAVTLTDIFSANANSTSVDFHAAADGMGATFSVMSVTSNGVTSLIGGYNPQSWNTSNNYFYAQTTSDRSAFLFNLTSGVRIAERLDNNGVYQTYNAANYGPTFGGGHDIYIDNTLKAGYANSWSYMDQSATLLPGASYQTFSVNSVDVYSITPVPEAQTYAMLLAGLALLSMVARRRSR